MKIINDLLEDILSFLDDFDQTDLRNYMIIFFTLLSMFLLGSSYYIYFTTGDLVRKIKSLDNQLVSALNLKSENMKILALEKAEQAFLTTNSIGSSLKAFIESKLSQAGVSPEAGWKESAKINPWPIDEAFEEEKVNLSFKKMSTAQLAEFLKAIYSQPAAIIRNITINKMSDGLTVNFVISYRYKKT